MDQHCLGKPNDVGRSGKNTRLFLEVVLRMVRTGSPQRDLPPVSWANGILFLNGSVFGLEQTF